MTVKKILFLTLVLIIGMYISAADVCAKTYSAVEINQMSDYDFYSTFAEALKNHDTKTIAFFVACDDDSQFEYKGVEITGYSVEILKKSREEYEGMRKAAKITFDIKKSNNSLFPKGKQAYYVYFDPYGYGTDKFYPYSTYEKPVSNKYIYGLRISLVVASTLTDYKSVSSNEIKKMEYNGEFIHSFYHVYLQNKYPDGISKAELTKEINKFYGSKNQISKEVLEDFRKEDGLYFKKCGHGGSIDIYRCQKITKSKKTGYYTYDIWFYSDAAAMNVCRKIKFTYDIKDGNYVLKKVNCYYSNDYKVKTFVI